jgi:hypothetical protein
MIVTGTPGASEAIIGPITPNCIIRMYPKGKSMAAEARVRCRMKVVFH